MGIRHYFGPIVISALEGYEKPDPRIFRLAASRAGVELEAMLHVGTRSARISQAPGRRGARG